MASIKIKPLTRPYVQAAQGRILKSKLDHQSGRYTAYIKVDTFIQAPTVVYAMTKGRSVPWYPSGFDAEVTGEDGNALDFELIKDGDENRFKFLVKDHGFHNKVLKVQITRKIIEI